MVAKIKHCICPICSGKTTEAQRLQNVDPESTLLIEVLPTTNLDLIYEKHIKGYNFKKIIIDNFLSLFVNKNNHVKKFLKLLKSSTIEEIVLFSTPDKIYDKEKDKVELKEKMLDESNVQIIKRTFFQGITTSNMMYLTSSLSPTDFKTKILGVVFNNEIP